ncbi:MAG TPA: hypothetical protein VNB06_08930 [Thermoanaerobaculia bacterium]|nr:hypothetical protein [Thermoanaerobaculia bacterium]
MRDAFAILLVLLLVALLGLFGWLTRRPEAPVFERAERAPVVGGAVAALRQRYLTDQLTDQIEAARRQPRANSGSGATAAPQPAAPDVSDREWIGLGATLRVAPSARAATLGRTRELWSYEVLERRAEWVRVRTFEGADAWIDLAAERDTKPPLGEDPLPPGPLPARKPDLARLQVALARLDSPAHALEIGGYQLFHDLDAAAWQRLAPIVEAAVEDVEAFYAERYGLEPIGSPAEVVVLFRDEQAYRQVQLAQPELGASPTTGHTAAGLVALFAGSRSPREIGSTLAHELGHLLGRRALGPALSSWLDEGLADDFATAVLARAAGGDPYAGWLTASPSGFEFAGPLAGLAVLLRRLAEGRLEPLEALVAMPRETFYAAPERERLYSQSAFFVRCLLERGLPGRPPTGATGFRAYLAAIRSGGAVDGEALLESLDTTWGELELAFRACLLHEGSRSGLDALSGRSRE